MPKDICTNYELDMSPNSHVVGEIDMKSSDGNGAILKGMP